MSSGDSHTEQLVRRAAQGDDQATEELLNRYRDRLRRMVVVRMDSRLVARVDPSDVVQETLAEAWQKLPDYVADDSQPFYFWLRKLACGHLSAFVRRHVQAQRRSVSREEPAPAQRSDESAVNLADQVPANGTSPSGWLVREETSARVRAALAQLAPHEREILVMRHLEQLQIGEIATILHISEEAVMMRRLRAFQKLRQVMHEDPVSEQ